MRIRFAIWLYYFAGFLLLGSPIALSQDKINSRIQETIDSLLKPPCPLDVYDNPPYISNVNSTWQQMTVDFFSPGEQQSRYGLINTQSKDSLDPVFLDIQFLKDRFFLRTENWSALVDEQLKVIAGFEDAKVHSSNYIKIRKGNRWGYIDPNLNELMATIYEDIELYYPSIDFVGDEKEKPYFLIKENGKWGMVKANLKIVHPLVYERMEEIATPWLIAKKDKYGLLNNRGVQLTPFKYDTLYYASLFGTMVARVNYGLGLVNLTTGKELTPFIYRSIGIDVEGGCRCVMKGEKWAIISTEGKELTAFVYDDVKWYILNYIPLRKNGKWGFYDCKNRKESTQFIYDDVVSHSGYEATVLQYGVNKKITLEKRY